MQKIFSILQYVLVAVVLLSSCEQDVIDDKEKQDQKDSSKPTVVINGLNDGLKVWNTTEFSVDATDDVKVDRVEFFFNDELVTELNEEPYEFSLNTRAFDDGIYSLKVVAYDSNGNSESQEIQVEVFNLLVEMRVGANYLTGNEEHYFFFSDNQGNQISEARKLINGQTIQVIRPEDFNDTAFVFTHTSQYKYANGSNENAYLYTYNGFTPRTLVLEQLVATNETETNFLVKVANLGSYLSKSNALSVYESTDGEYQIFEVTKSGDYAFYLRLEEHSTNQSKYILLEDYTEGAEYVYDFLELPEYETIEMNIPKFGEADNFYNGTYGYDLNGNSFTFNYDSYSGADLSSTEGIISLEYSSDEIFTTYRNFVSLSFPNGTNFYGSVYGSELSENVPVVDLVANIEQISPTEIKPVSLGNSTACFASWMYNSFSGELIYWRVYGAPGSTIIRPQLPTNFVEDYTILNNETTYSDAGIVKYEGAINSYEDFVSFVLDPSQTSINSVDSHLREERWVPQATARTAESRERRSEAIRIGLEFSAL